MKVEKSCDTCKFNVTGYADGYILKNFERFCGDVSNLPTKPDKSKFWTFQECSKNKKKLEYINIINDCKAHVLVN